MRFAGNLAFGLLASWRALWIPKPDVVLVTTSPLLGPIAAKLLAGLRGIPYVYIVYDLDPDRTVALGLKSEEARSVKLLRRWQSSWLKGAAGIVAIGRCMNDYLVRTYGLVRDRVHTVEVGADPNVVRPLPRETEFRKRENLNGFVVLYSGNFGQYHDFDTLLGAAEILKKSHPQVQFALVGGGHKREYVAEEVKRRNLDNVRLFGFVPEEELADLLASADLSVVTLEPGMEGLCVPSKFYTCLASGRPVLALMNPNCEVAYAVEESQCGMCAPIGEPETVAKAIVTLAESPERRATMGANSRHVFDQKYAMPVITGRIAEILRDVVDAKRRGASR
jgi:glycosyltransferase involved in cell wall biosynthesis